ncbi:MAG: DMT family transporter [Rhodospirillales bacterium]
MPTIALPVRGVLWMVLAAFCFAVTIGFVRSLSASYTVFEIVLIRQVIGTALMLPWLLRIGAGGLRTQRFGLHCARAVGIYGAVYASYLSAVMISLADSTALQFTLPMFTILFAVVFLKERVGAHRWVATGLGFAGMLLIVRPGFAEVSAGMLVAIAAAAMFGASDVATRYLTGRESTGAVVFWGYFLQLPISIVVAIPDMKMPPLDDVPTILAFSLAAFGAQWFLTKAFADADATLVSPVLFLRLPFVSVIGWFFFAEAPEAWTWIGAAVIVLGTWYGAQREAAQHRAARQAQPGR